MRIVLDRPRCEGHGLCEEAAPDLMHLDDEGELVIDVEEFEAGSAAAAAAARRRARSARSLRCGSNDAARRRGGSSSSATASPGSPRPTPCARVGFDGELTLVGDETAPGLQPAGAVEGAAARRRRPHQPPAARRRRTERPSCGAYGRPALDPQARTVLLDDGDRLAVRRSRHRDRLPGAPAHRGRPDPADELTLRTLEDALALRAADRRRGPTSSSSAAARSAWRSPRPVSTRGAQSRSCPAGARSCTSSAGTCPTSSWPLALARGLRLDDGGCGAPGARGRRRPASSSRDGRSLEAALVVTAVGDLPNVEWLASSGLLRGGAARGRCARAGSAPTSSPPETSPRSLRRPGSGGCRCGPPRSSQAATRRQPSCSPTRCRPTTRPYFWTEQFGLSLKAVGHLPFGGEPALVDGDPGEDRSLLQWGDGGSDGAGAAAAVNYRIPIPRLRRLCDAVA